jgi:hypothetical protein
MSLLPIKGRVRSIKVSILQMGAHYESVMHWVNGGDVEEAYGQDWVTIMEEPDFLVTRDYRPLVVRPHTGEIWLDTNGAAYMAAHDFSFKGLDGLAIMHAVNGKYAEGLTFAYSTLNSYFDREVFSYFENSK